MPQGMGTYGSKKGRPPGKKKKVAVVKKKKKVAPTGNQGRKWVVKKKPVNTPSAPAGYSRRTRMDMADKEALSGGVAKKTKRKSKVIGAGMNPFPKKKKIVKVGGPKKMKPMTRKKKSK